MTGGEVVVGVESAGIRGADDDDDAKKPSAKKKAPVDGILGGGKGGPTPLLPGDDDDDDENGGPIDPTEFYAHLTSYTAAAQVGGSRGQHSRAASAGMYVDTSSVGDAANVFRCLINALEHSASREGTRLERAREVAEIDDWNNNNGNEEEEGKDDEEGKGGEEEEEGDDDDERLKRSVERLREAVRREWEGVLLSRIVGTLATSSSTIGNPMMPASSSTSGITTTTTLRRTKRNGEIERPLPVPFPLPVVMTTADKMRSDEAAAAANENNARGAGEDDEDGRRYFPSLTTALHSVTIDPNPIRGYDWRGLMKRGDVEEESFVVRTDAHGREVTTEEEEEEEEKVEESDGAGGQLTATPSEEDITLAKMPSTESNGGEEGVDKTTTEEDGGGKPFDTGGRNSLSNMSTEDLSKSLEADLSKSLEAAKALERELNESLAASSAMEDDIVQQEAPPPDSDVDDDDEDEDDDDDDDDDEEFTVVSESVASRTISCQVDFGYDVGAQASAEEIAEGVEALSARYRTIEVNPNYEEEQEEARRRQKEEEEEARRQKEEEEESGEAASSSAGSKKSNNNKFAIERDACYAAAVMALGRSRGASVASARRGRGTSVASRESRRFRDPSADSHRSYRSRHEMGTSMDDVPTEDGPTMTESPRVARTDRGAPFAGMVGQMESLRVSRSEGRRGTSTASHRRGRAARGTSVASAGGPRHRIRDPSVDSIRSRHSRARGTSVASAGSRGRATRLASRSIMDTEVQTPNDAEPTNLVETADDGSIKMTYEASPGMFARLPGINTPLGMNVGASPQEASSSPEEESPEEEEEEEEEEVSLGSQMKTSILAYMPSARFLMPADDDDDDDDDDEESHDSSSDDEDSIDSKVSSVDSDDTSEEESPGGGPGDDDDDNSSQTHSSAIETPPDIDEIFDELSWSDDSLDSDDDEEEKEDGDVLRAAADEEEETAAAAAANTALLPNIAPSSPKEHEGPHSMSVSTVSDSNSSSSSSSSSSASSSTSTSSTDSSSSESSDDDSSDDATSSSSSSAEIYHIAPEDVSAVPVEQPDSGGGIGRREDGDVGGVAPRLHLPAPQRREEWITRKETRFLARTRLPRSLVFHLKRFEYSTRSGRAEKLPGRFDVPEELDLRTFCLESKEEHAANEHGRDEEPYRYRLVGAIVHADPVEEEEEAAYGEASEGHYVALVCGSVDGESNAPQDKKGGVAAWTEVDDGIVRKVPDSATSEGMKTTDDAKATTASPTVDSGTSGNTTSDRHGEGRPHPALEIINGCDVTNHREEPATGAAATGGKRAVAETERRYATLVVYSRKLDNDVP